MIWLQFFFSFLPPPSSPAPLSPPAPESSWLTDWLSMFSLDSSVGSCNINLYLSYLRLSCSRACHRRSSAGFNTFYYYWHWHYFTYREDISFQSIGESQILTPMYLEMCCLIMMSRNFLSCKAFSSVKDEYYSQIARPGASNLETIIEKQK